MARYLTSKANKGDPRLRSALGEDIAELARLNLIDPSALVDRAEVAMDYYIGDPSMLRSNLIFNSLEPDGEAEDFEAWLRSGWLNVARVADMLQAELRHERVASRC